VRATGVYTPLDYEERHKQKSQPLLLVEQQGRP